MTSQIFQALILAVTLTDMHQNQICPQMKEDMKCETTEQFIGVNHGENLILNCTCFNKTNGQWVGPNRSPTLYTTADTFIPYTQGIELNPVLNISKFGVFGGYDKKECQLQIVKFVSDDEGLYKCRYTDSSTVYIHTYNVVAIMLLILTTSFVDISTINMFDTKNLDYHDAKIFNEEWMMPLAVIILVFFVATVVTMRIRKGNSGRDTSQVEVIEEDSQADSVENRLYQSPAFLEMNNFSRHNRVTRNEFVSSSQIHGDERYGGLNATERARESVPNRRDVLYPDAHAQMNEINLNYAEVMFDVERSSRHFIIHGNDERTIYSDIDHLSRAEPLPSSSSESEDD